MSNNINDLFANLNVPDDVKQMIITALLMT